MARESGIALSASESCIGRLAQLFPDATPVRIPVQVISQRAGGRSLVENTVIEFGTPSEVLFASTLPLEFDDSLRLRNSDGSLDAEASVVAVQYYEGHKAVAARFSSQVSNWIIKRCP
ncbi:MAG TPA: hypothetical protein VG033_07205 [Candidatus Acidoferrales bacterium]|nr:hypothetical protein [Candidatus Acidoferrales bacterium]